MARNFTCPESEQLCERGDCKRALCVERIDNDNRQEQVKAMARERDKAFFEEHPEHLNLDDFL